MLDFILLFQRVMPDRRDWRIQREKRICNISIVFFFRHSVSVEMAKPSVTVAERGLILRTVWGFAVSSLSSPGARLDDPLL